MSALARLELLWFEAFSFFLPSVSWTQLSPAVTVTLSASTCHHPHFPFPHVRMMMAFTSFSCVCSFILPRCRMRCRRGTLCLNSPAAVMTRLAEMRKGSESGCGLRRGEDARLMERGVKVRWRWRALSVHLIGRDEVRQRSAASPEMI